MGIIVLIVERYAELTNAVQNAFAVEVFCRVVE
jgi:hypothetical protein